MKKNKLFIFLPIITTILIFGLAATCNLCGAPISIGETDSTKDTILEKNVTDNSMQSEDTSDTSASGSQGEVIGDSTEDTGEESEIVDNDENQNQPQDEGEHSFAEEVEPEIVTPEIQETEFFLPVVENECGVLYLGHGMTPGRAPGAGDSWNDKSEMGFISFDISMLSDATINEAILEMDGGIHGDPSFFNKFWINSIYWGPISISDVSSDILKGEGIIIEDYPSDGSCDINCSNPKLKEEIQKYINESKPRFQLRIHFSGPYTDSDGADDEWYYLFDNIKLKIIYTT